MRPSTFASARGSRSAALLALALPFAAGCEDEQPIPSGNLARPSGLAYVPRTPRVESAGGPPLARSDLLVADSEAQGVRIAQFGQTLASDGAIVELPPFFVPAPVSFFKLAAQAPGFPTDIAVAPPSPAGPDGIRAVRTRAYVLAPTAARLHVLEVGETRYQADATTDTNVPLGGVDLGADEPGRVPVALARLGTLEDFAAGSGDAFDVVVVAFDGFGASTGKVRLYGFSRATNAPGDPLRLGEIEVAAGVSDLLVRAELRRVLVSSTSSTAVVELPLTGTATAGDLDFGAPRALDAGGPVGALVDAGAAGAFALRQDRSAATWLEIEDGRFVRSRDRLPSPYDARDPADRVVEPGVLTLRRPLAVAGAHAALGSLFIPDFEPPVFAGATRDVVLIAHEDARVLYITRERSDDALPGILPLGEGLQISTAFPSAVTDEGAPILSLEPCGGPLLQCTPEPAPDPYCTTAELRGADADLAPYLGSGALRLTPRGSLYTGRGLQFRQQEIDEAARTLTFTAVDPARTDFGPFRLRFNDTVRLLLQVRGCEDEEEPVELQLEGELLGTGRGTDVRGAVERPGAQLRARVRVIASSAQSSGPGEILSKCEDALQFPSTDTLREIEVHVPDGVDEAVLAEVSSEQVVRVLERAPMALAAAPGGFQAQIELGASPDSGSPFRIRALSAIAPSMSELIEQIDCDRLALDPSEPEATQIDALGPCLSGVECGIGRACLGASGRCPGRCSASCVGSCLQTRESRVCPRLDLSLFGAGVLLDLQAAVLSLTQRQRRENVRFGSLPADVVFHPARASFFVSLPGARSLVEVPTRPGLRLLRVR